MFLPNALRGIMMANEWHLHVSPPIFIESRLTRDFTFLVFSMSSIVFLHLKQKPT